MKHVSTFLLLLLASSVGYLSSALAQHMPMPRTNLAAKTAITQPPSTGAARQSSPLATTIRYVKAGGSGTGASWSNASGDLQAMIDASASGDQVWIASGTYKPSITGLGNARDASFSLKNGVSVLGGFTGVAGTEGNASTRTATPSSTTLSGDIGTIGDESDNAYHVVFNNQNGLDNSALQDGVVMTAGNANGASDGSTPGIGGGMCNRYSSPTVLNCQFVMNAASYLGGGLSNGFNSAKITNCSFINNRGGYGSGAVEQGTGVYTNCYFAQNQNAASDPSAVGGGWC